MTSWLLLVLRTLSGMARSRASLSAENAILRHQLSVLQRERPRPLLRPADRVLWIWLCRHWYRWRSALVLIQPAGVTLQVIYAHRLNRVLGGTDPVSLGARSLSQLRRILPVPASVIALDFGAKVAFWGAVAALLSLVGWVRFQ
jgi:hypothetical protein